MQFRFIAANGWSRVQAALEPVMTARGGVRGGLWA